MKHTLTKIACLVLVALLTGCGDDDNGPPEPVAIILAPGQSVVLDDFKVRVELDSVTWDDRCPDGAGGACSWPGFAEIRLRVTPSGGTTVEQHIAVGGLHPPDDGSVLWPVQVAGSQFVLTQLLPYPETGVNIDYADYRAYLTVREPAGVVDQVTPSSMSPVRIFVRGYGLDSIWTVRERLHVNVSHPNCAPNYYSAFMPEQFRAGDPPTATVNLRRFTRYDGCNDQDTVEVRFQLGRMTEIYRQQFNREDSFRIEVFQPSGESKSLIYYPTPPQ